MLATGQHEVAVQYADADIQGSPFYPEVYDVTQVIVGYSEDGLVGQQVVFDGRYIHGTALYITA